MHVLAQNDFVNCQRNIHAQTHNSTVFKCFFDSRVWIVKCVDVFDERDEELVNREVEIFRLAQHSKHVVRLHAAFPLDMQVCIAMDFCENTYTSLIHHGICVSDTHRYMSELTGAVAHLHGMRIVHADIKPDNMFMCHGRVVLGDFGNSFIGSYEGMRGTPFYMAPEALKERPSASSDLWSVGVVMYESLTGKRPFHAADLDHLRQQLTGADYTPPILNRLVAPSIVQDCINELLAQDSCTRITSAAMSKTLTSHAWAEYVGAQTMLSLEGSELRVSLCLSILKRSTSPTSVMTPRTCKPVAVAKEWASDRTSEPASEPAAPPLPTRFQRRRVTRL